MNPIDLLRRRRAERHVSASDRYWKLQHTIAAGTPRSDKAAADLAVELDQAATELGLSDADVVRHAAMLAEARAIGDPTEHIARLQAEQAKLHDEREQAQREWSAACAAREMQVAAMAERGNRNSSEFQQNSERARRLEELRTELAAAGAPTDIVEARS